MAEFMSASKVEPDYNEDELLFESILHDIKNLNVLSSYQMQYLKRLPRGKLLQIIDLYNVVIHNVGGIL